MKNEIEPDCIFAIGTYGDISDMLCVFVTPREYFEREGYSYDGCLGDIPGYSLIMECVYERDEPADEQTVYNEITAHGLTWSKKFSDFYATNDAVMWEPS